MTWIESSVKVIPNENYSRTYGLLGYLFRNSFFLNLE